MELEFFKDFDFASFWSDCDYSREKYVEPPPAPEVIREIEQELGYKLPASYIELMTMQNGGTVEKDCFPTQESTSWAPDHISITGIFGIGRDKMYSLCGELGGRFMMEEWGYPDSGIYICDCPSGGHDMVLLDYSKCGTDGEPEVVHVDQVYDFKKTFLAKDFESFIKGLVRADVYDTTAEDLKRTLATLETGQFSSLLQEFFRADKSVDYAAALREWLFVLTRKKECFALHADEISHFIYDALFYLYSKNRRIPDQQSYLKEYPAMIVFGDGEITTGGYASGFVEEWLADRISRKLIVVTEDGLSFSESYRLKVFEKLRDTI